MLRFAYDLKSLFLFLVGMDWRLARKYNKPDRVFFCMLLGAFEGMERLVPLFTRCLFRRSVGCCWERFAAWRRRRPSELRDDNSASESDSTCGKPSESREGEEEREE